MICENGCPEFVEIASESDYVMFAEKRSELAKAIATLVDLQKTDATGCNLFDIITELHDMRFGIV